MNNNELGLDTDLKEAIDKNLSKALGTRLQERFAELEAKEKRLAAMESDLQVSNKQNSILEEKLSKHVDLDDKISDIVKRESQLEKEKRDLEMEKLKVRFEESEKRSDMVMNFTSTLCKNTMVKKTIFDSESNPTGAVDQYGNPIYTYSNKSYTETEEKE